MTILGALRGDSEETTLKAERSRDNLSVRHLRRAGGEWVRKPTRRRRNDYLETIPVGVKGLPIRKNELLIVGTA